MIASNTAAKAAQSLAARSASPSGLKAPAASAAARSGSLSSSGGGLGHPGGSPTVVGRVYRLVDRQGNPHPVLDDLYETLDAAWSEALAWWGEQRSSAEPVEIGVEVSTTSGSWRTLRHPAG